MCEDTLPLTSSVLVSNDHTISRDDFDVRWVFDEAIIVIVVFTCILNKLPYKGSVTELREWLWVHFVKELVEGGKETDKRVVFTYVLFILDIVVSPIREGI